MTGLPLRRSVIAITNHRSQQTEQRSCSSKQHSHSEQYLRLLFHPAS